MAGTRSFLFYFHPLDQKFPKSEKLKSTKEIQATLSLGKSMLDFPLLVKYHYFPDASPTSLQVRMAPIVPKRKLRKAVHRNRVKRQLRNSYRLNKYLLNPLHNSINGRLNLLFIYQAPELMETEKIESSMKKLMLRMIPRLSHDKASR